MALRSPDALTAAGSRALPPAGPGGHHGSGFALRPLRPEAAPGHVPTVRHDVIGALTDEQVDQLAGVGAAILARLDPTGAMAATYTRHDEGSAPQAG